MFSWNVGKTMTCPRDGFKGPEVVCVSSGFSSLAGLGEV